MVPRPPESRPPVQLPEAKEELSEAETLVILGLARSKEEAEARLEKSRVTEQRRAATQKNAMEIERLHLERMKEEVDMRARRRKQLLRKMALNAQTASAVKAKAAKEQQQARFSRSKALQAEEAKQLEEDKHAMLQKKLEIEKALTADRKLKAEELRQKARFKKREQKQRTQALAETRKLWHSELVDIVAKKGKKTGDMEARRQASFVEYARMKQSQFARIKAKVQESQAEQEAREKMMRTEFDKKLAALEVKKESSMASLGSARSSMSTLRRNSPRFQPGA